MSREPERDRESESELWEETLERVMEEERHVLDALA